MSTHSAMKSISYRAVYLVALAAICLGATAQAHALIVKGNRILLDGKAGVVLYRATGDLDHDGTKETVLSVETCDNSFRGIIVARRATDSWRLVAEQDEAYCLRSDVTDINGDGRLEIVARGHSGDGHGTCTVYTFEKQQLVEIGSFGKTRFRDLDSDGIPEALSTGWVSFGFVGDHWLTIYKWNGRGYVDVSRQFPKQYDSVILDLRNVIYLLRYTEYFGDRFQPQLSPELFADMYHALGKAYDYRGLPDKAREQFAIAYRLAPDDEEIAAAFRRAWGKSVKLWIKPK